MKKPHDKRSVKNATGKSVAKPDVVAAPPRSNRRWIGPIVGLVLISGSIAFGSWSYKTTVRSQTYSTSFIGRNSCAACHSAETQKWTGSHHDLAMDLATEATVVDPKAFDDQAFTAHGITSKFFRRGDKFMVTTDGPTGAMETFEIKYVFGVDPLQQYMIEFPEKKMVRNPQGQELELPGNRVQVLSIAWDTKKHRWFHLYPTRKFAAGDWLHWTGGGQNWNFMCAECHSTDLQKKYDVASNTYHTTFAEIDVSCEACHGPAGEHVARAQSTLGFLDPRHFHSYALNKLKSPDSLAEIETCAQCHSRRRIVHGDYRPGRNFNDYYEPSTLEGNLYHADGQIREELYEHGSFLQSRMFREGVKCSNCHDPHSLKPKFEGNALCTQCHIPAKYDTPTHHHHKFDSAGAKCVECHMPETTYMEVDPRRDHSIRIPRPDLTKKLGTPNACAPCHKKPEENTDWLMAKVVEWYGPKRSDSKHYGETLEAGRRHDPHAAAGLIELAKPKPMLTSDERAKAVGPVVRASAVALLSGYDDLPSREAIEHGMYDADPLVRAAAIRAIENRPLAQLPGLQEALGALLDDPVRTVRTDAARALARTPPPAQSELRTKFNRVFQEWLDGQAANSDRAATHAGIALAYTDLLRGTEDLKYAPLAEAECRKALEIDPAFLPGIINYAALKDVINDDADAERLYREALALLPKLDQPEAEIKQLTANLEFDLGWLLLRDAKANRIVEALGCFQRCLALDPNNAGAWHHLGVTQLELNRFTEGADSLTRFAKLDPQGPEALVRYAERAMRGGRKDHGRAYLAALLAVDPELRKKYPQIDELLRQSDER